MPEHPPGNTHAPPTGKKCKQTPPVAGPEPGNADNAVLSAINELAQTVKDMAGRVSKLESHPQETLASGVPDPRETSADASPEQYDGDEDNLSGSGSDSESATPNRLRQDVRLREKVQKRLGELDLLESEDDTPRRSSQSDRGKKSGRSKTANDIIVRDVDWPHFYVYRGPSRQAATYEDLSLGEFAFGYICSVLDAGNVTASTNVMLRYLRDILRDAIDFPWPVVRNFHGVVAQQIELGRLDWADKDKIQDLRSVYVVRPPESTPGQQAPATQGPPFCLPYQRGACNVKAPQHNTPRGQVKHMCAFCFKQTGVAYNHAEADCRRKQSSVSKNLAAEQ